MLIPRPQPAPPDAGAQVADAVERGLFHVYTMGHVSEGIALLTGEASGMSPAELVQSPGG